ncbi:FAD:protein FMN transferase [Shewanella decolorationis]|uniref:FAD:protein FMN transferase n=1 Tax=Shewanella decolorationis TaxID=256839 RepID=A0A5B8R6S4_9GAMM|nr:FAD:protein FMN transferase [Shewanella decolorationis]QDZ93179.1 FAD:protein FMN transferase [Shewanella decolorationis]
MIRRAKPLLGTLVEIAVESVVEDPSLPTLDEQAMQAAITAAFSRIAQIGRLLSFHQQDSELNLLNRQPGNWVLLSQDSLRVFKLAKWFGKASDNLFNCTIGGEMMSRGALPCYLGMPLLLQGDWQDIEIRANQARLARPLIVTLDGIAKGYAVDMAVSELRRAGVSGGWVNAGGDLKVFGSASLDVLCRGSNGLSQKVTVRNMALASSRVSQQLSLGCPALLLPTGNVDMMSFDATSERVVSVQAPFAWRADALTKVAGYLSADVAKEKIQLLGGQLVC